MIMEMQNLIQVLGAFGGRGQDVNASCLQLTNSVLIDAGNVLKPLGESAQFINHIFLTHAHLDHILDIPFLIDAFFEKREEPLILYGTKGTLDAVKSHLLNNNIWPDFSQIPLLNKKNNAIVFEEIHINQIIHIDGIGLKVIANNHTQSSCGYVVSKDEQAILYSSDTYICDSLWEEVNENRLINSIIVDVSFPSRFEQLALDSKHLTPELLANELKKLRRNDVTVFINHLKPAYIKEITEEIHERNLLWNNGAILKDLDFINTRTKQVTHSFDTNKKQVEHLNKIGYALTSEKDFNVLMEKILDAAKELTNADAGTIYLMSDDEERLKFKIVHTDSMNFKMGGTGEDIPWPDLPLRDEQGQNNLDKISVKCALEKKLINISNVYETKGFDFTGPKNFDMATGYTTKSMLVVPLVNHDNDVVGVLQLINKNDIYSNLVDFSLEDEKLILSMGSQAAVAITNARLIKDLETLLNAFIKSIATAIGEKSKYTVGHINRVADITLDIAKAINSDKCGQFKDVFYDDDELKQMDIAAWMHDIGKIATPEYIVDKATKLETIHDRIHLIEAKFEIFKRDLELQYYKDLSIASAKNKTNITQSYEKEILSLNNDLEFIRLNNKGTEFMRDESVNRILEMGEKSICINGEQVNLLTQDELDNLTIRKGTLTQEERFIINNHAHISLKMLESLPFPKKLKDVPRIAGGHHEKIKGGGYPRNLKGDEISFETRILAIADIFEALTAHDRPYKEPNTLSQSLKILYFMAKDDELDRELVKFFIENKIYLSYIEHNLMPSQMDEVNVDCSDL